MELRYIYQERYFLGMVVVVGLLIRALVFYGYLQHDARYWQVDSATYHCMGIALAEGKGFTKSDGCPQVHRLPGYSAFLAPFYKITKDPCLALWVQLVLASFIPLLLFCLSLLLFPGALVAARISALWAMMHLGFILYAGFLMTESLFILLFLLFLCLFVSLLQRIRVSQKVWHYALASGLVLGLASLVRPVGHLLAGLSMLLIVWMGWVHCGKAIKTSLLFFCAWLLPAGAWLLRNYLLTGYIFFHSLPGGHFLYLSAARVAMHVHDCSYQEARQLLRSEVLERVAALEKNDSHKLSEIEWCFVQEKLAKEYFCKAPLITMKTWLTDIMRTTLSLYSAELLYFDAKKISIDYFAKGRGMWSWFERYLFPATKNNWLKIIVYSEIITHAILLFMSFAYMVVLGFALLRRKVTNYMPAAILPFIGLFIGIALAGGYARMRLPIEPLLMVFAVQGCALWKREKKELS